MLGSVFTALIVSSSLKSDRGVLLHFSVLANQAGLLNFLCETRTEDDKLEPSMDSTRLYTGGGCKDEIKSVFITDGSLC